MSPLSVLASMSVVATVCLFSSADSIAAQDQPRTRTAPATGQQPEPTRKTDPEPAAEPQRRAQPRSPENPPRNQASPRRPAPPPRVGPPQYHRTPRVHFFPPVSLHRGFYYHPYFGFYYGPYYGPFYPYPGPYPAMERFSAVAIRTRVKPVETEVWVNGYFAGLADDFDGLFQRLYLPYGEHEIEFHLEGYRTFSQRLYLTPGDTRELVHQMQPLPAGAVSADPVSPLAVPDEWTSGATAAVGDLPASPFGILTLSVTPADAQVVVDGEVWLRADTRSALVIHVPAGSHQLEIRKAGFQTFRTGIELSAGGTTRLDVHLVP